MRIALFGATGRVGQAFLKEAGSNKRYDIYALAREPKERASLASGTDQHRKCPESR
ncbi:uncharacterized protein YbjT (DUF2867 family) [Bacillus atrophaeus]|nr:uncharacterized protein YbjT (DUF2867 family) [Bacillus atrophaeus]